MILTDNQSVDNSFTDVLDDLFDAGELPKLVENNSSFIENPQQIELFEPSQYLNENKWGFFSILVLKPGNNWRLNRQYTYPLNRLKEQVEYWRERGKRDGLDVYITQAAFSRPNRRKVNCYNIGQVFVDIDYYNSPNAYVRTRKPHEMVNLIYQHCEMHDLPYPSLIMHSGRGMYAKWLFDAIPKKVLKMWEHVENHFVALFDTLGSDANAKDLSRVLRLQGTVNHKTGEFTHVLDMIEGEDGEPARYRFEDLARKVLPYSIEDAVEYKKKQKAIKQQILKERKAQKRDRDSRMRVYAVCNELSMSKGEITAQHVYDYLGKGVISIEKIDKFLGTWKKARERGHITDAARLFKTKNLNWLRFQDILNIAKHRYGEEGCPDGFRDIFMLFGTNFFSLSEYRKADKNFWHEFQQIGHILVPSWNGDKIRNSCSDIYKRLKETQDGKTVKMNGVEYPRLLTPRNQRLINDLEISEDEMMLQNPDGSFLINTVISADAKAKRKPIHQKRRRREAGIQSREEYLTDKKGQATERLRKAAELRSQGKTNAEVAEAMGITPKAVKSLMTRARQQGLVD